MESQFLAKVVYVFIPPINLKINESIFWHQNDDILTDQFLVNQVPELVFVFMIVFASNGIMECCLTEGFNVMTVEESGESTGSCEI